ncbi:MAG: UbiA family prenyltransferase [Actinomycetales bacterium]
MAAPASASAPRRGPGVVARGLLLSCHPLPTVAVTAFVTILGLTNGAAGVRAVLLCGTVLAGQLAIGWANDALDAERDRVVGRTDKPVAAGVVPRRVVAGAAVVAVVVSVLLSVPLGLAVVLLHALVVACGLGYDLGLKATAWSLVPYLVAFGALPAVATLAAVGGVVVWWLVVTGALLGAAAHFANAAADTDDDVATGVLGLPQRLGPARSLLAAGASVTGAAVVVAVASAAGPVVVAIAAVAAALALGGTLGGWGSRVGATGAASLAFRSVLAAAGLLVLATVLATLQR